MKINVIGLLAVLLFGVAGCQETAQTSETLLPPPPVTPEAAAPQNLNSSYHEAIKLYKEFLLIWQEDTEGEEGYFDEMRIDHYYYAMEPQYRFALIDMSGDGVPELVVDGHRFAIFALQEGGVKIWYSARSVRLLNNKAMICERGHGTYKSYDYIELDQNGEERVSVYMTKAYSPDIAHEYSDPARMYTVGDDSFATPEDWEKAAEPYLSIGDDMIPWIYYAEWYEAQTAEAEAE